MAGVNDFIQNYMGMQRNRIAQQQADTQEQATNAQISLQGIQGFIEALRNTDNPIEQRAMAEVMSQRGVAPMAVFDSLMRNVGPSVETQRARGAQRGSASLQKGGAATTGAEWLDRETAARAFAMQSMQEVGASRFLAELVNVAGSDPQQGNLADAYRTRLAAGQDLGSFDLAVNLRDMPGPLRQQRARVAAEVTPGAVQAA